MRLVGFDPPLRFDRVESPTMTIVAKLGFRRLLFGSQSLETLAGAKTRIGCTSVNQQSSVVSVDLGSFALPIRTERATNIGALVPPQSEPCQSLDDHGFTLDTAPCAVGILNPQHEGAALLPRKSVVE
jgi:hypothetical protein